MTDSRGLFDKMKQLVLTPKGRDRRSDIEALIIKHSINMTELYVWWVNGSAQLANSLTKGSEPWQLKFFFSAGQRWRLVYDPYFDSARKRQQKGLGALEDVPQEDATESHEVP